MGNCGGRWRDGARPMCWRWGLPKGGAALPRAHPSHCPGDPSTLGPPLVGHETPSSANRWLVPLEASAPEDSPSMPSPSPLETTRGTVIVVDNQGKRIAVLIGIEEYHKLLEELEELDSIRAYDAAKASGDERIPFDEAIREIEQHSE